MEVDKYILTEALSAFMGVTVKLESDCKGLDGVIHLDITSLTAASLLGCEVFAVAFQPVNFLTSVLRVFSVGNQQNSKNNIFSIPDDLFDPRFDFDFRDMSESDSESEECTRGGEPYKRPYGWMRFALKVWDKYPDGNAWLGKTIRNIWRNGSVPGEWPVSYHGTDLKGAEGIIKSHFKAGNRQAYGRGIYSSPDINVADDYATSVKFRSQKNGKTYKVIMQNRVNPKRRTIIKKKNFWLVPIPEGTSVEEEKEIVESSIHPYGLLLKEL